MYVHTKNTNQTCVLRLHIFFQQDSSVYRIFANITRIWKVKCELPSYISPKRVYLYNPPEFEITELNITRGLYLQKYCTFCTKTDLINTYCFCFFLGV